MYKNLTTAFILTSMLLTATPTLHAQNLVASPFTAPKQSTITYEQLLQWGQDNNTVILDSFKLEPFLHIAPPHIAQKDQNSITQQQLDQLLAQLIPQKDTRIVLFCWENFAATRKLSARSIIGMALEKNGYHNIHYLKDLWNNGSELVAQETLTQQEEKVRSLATPIPDIKTYNQSKTSL